MKFCRRLYFEEDGICWWYEKIPNEIIIKVTKDKSPIKGVLLFLEFVTIKKNNHIVITPATDAKGIVKIENEIILSSVEEDCNYFDLIIVD